MDGGGEEIQEKLMMKKRRTKNDNEIPGSSEESKIHVVDRSVSFLTLTLLWRSLFGVGQFEQMFPKLSTNFNGLLTKGFKRGVLN